MCDGDGIAVELAVLVDGAVGLVMAPRGARWLAEAEAIDHAGVPQFAVPRSPPLGRSDRDLKPLSGPAQSPTVLDNATSQSQSSGF